MMNIHKSMCNRAMIACLGSALTYLPSADCQTVNASPKSSPTSSSITWANGANRWRLSPTDQSAQTDPIPLSARAARSAYLLPMLQMGGYQAGGSYDYIRDTPEIKVKGMYQDLTWVVAKFASYRVVSADDTNDLLYTEESFKISKVIHNSSTSPVSAGSTIDAFLLGGRLRTPDDVVHSSHLEPSKYHTIPGRTYILALVQRPGGFFAIMSNWDVTDGVVLESSAGDQMRAQKGTSEIVGKQLEDAISYIQNKLSIQ